MEAALGQVAVGAGVEAAHPVLLAVLVRDDDHGDRLQSRASCLIVRTSSMPSIRGMSTSLTTRSILARRGPRSSRPCRRPRHRRRSPGSRSCRSSSRTVIESSTTRTRFGRRACGGPLGGGGRPFSRRPPSRLSIERTRSSTSTIRTGQPSSRTEALLMFGHLAQPGVERPDLAGRARRGSRRPPGRSGGRGR